MAEGEVHTGIEGTENHHVFQLRKLAPHSSSVRVDLSPLAPSFNHDHLHYTPAFVLTSPAAHLDHYNQLHQERVNEMVL